MLSLQGHLEPLWLKNPAACSVGLEFADFESIVDEHKGAAYPPVAVTAGIDATGNEVTEL